MARSTDTRIESFDAFDTWKGWCGYGSNFLGFIPHARHLLKFRWPRLWMFCGLKSEYREWAIVACVFDLLITRRPGPLNPFPFTFQTEAGAPASRTGSCTNLGKAWSDLHLRSHRTLGRVDGNRHVQVVCWNLLQRTHRILEHIGSDRHAVLTRSGERQRWPGQRR